MKNTINAWLFLVVGLALAIWELMHHWWFWVGLAVVVGLVWLYYYNKGAARRKYLERMADKPQWTPPVTSRQVEPDLKEYMAYVFVNDQGKLSMTLPDGATLPPPTGDAQFDALQRSRILDQWDAARKKLQQIAYGMVSETPEAKAEFTKFMKIFAEKDPLLSSILKTVMPVVQSSPGVLQTALYRHLPGIEVEEVRYALYFSEQLGILRREKKGNTYRLLPIGDVIDI